MAAMFDKEQLLMGSNIGVLATVGPGNRPHAMPIWYVYENSVFVMTSGRGSQKVRNIQRRSEATLVIDRREIPYFAVMVRGRAEIGPPPSQGLRLRLAIRYLGEELGRSYNARTTGSGSVTITVHPDAFIEFHGKAGRE